MKREQALVKNTIILTFGKFVPQIFNLITLPIITGQLTTHEYGTYDLIITLVSLLLPVTTLQIQSAAFRFLIDDRKSQKNSKSIITNIMVFTVPTSTIVLILLFFVLNQVPMGTRVLVCIYFMADILVMTLGQIARGLSYNKEYALSSIVLSVVNAVLIVATLSIQHYGLNGVLLAAGISNIVSMMYLMRKIRLIKYYDKSMISIDELKRMLKYSWPMVPNNLSTWVLKISDRIVITFFLGIEANAIYAVANKLPNILNVARGTFVMAWQENASVVSNDKDATEYYSKMFDRIFSMIIGMTGILIALTPLLFRIFIRGNYDEAYYQMPLLFIGVFFGCISAFQGGIYVAYMKTKSVGITTTLAAACNLILDLLLVKRIGITAGSISTLVSYLILFIYRMFDVWKIQKIEYRYGKLILECFVIIIMSGLCFIRKANTDILNFIIGCAFCIVVNKEILKGLIDTWCKKEKK